MQHLPEPLVAGQPCVGQPCVGQPPVSASAWSKQAIARRSISSCAPLPLWIRTTEVSSPYASEYMGGPPSASAQYAASRSEWSGR